MFYKWETYDLVKNPQKYLEIFFALKDRDKIRFTTKGKIKWVENSCWLELNKSYHDVRVSSIFVYKKN